MDGPGRGLGGGGGQQSDEGAGLLARVEKLAEEAARQVSLGEVQVAVDLLKDAYSLAGGRDGAEEAREEGGGDAQAEAEAPPDAGACEPGSHMTLPQARASVCLLLCAVLSQAERHDEALGAGRAALKEMESAWRAELPVNGQPGANRLAEAAFANLVFQPPLWFCQALETSVQAKLCVALELEFMSARISPSSTTPGMRRDVEQLHLEAFLLSRHLLPRGHEVRLRAQRARGEWEQRIAEGGVAVQGSAMALDAMSDERAAASDLLAMLSGAPPAAPGGFGEEIEFGEMLMPLEDWHPTLRSDATAGSSVRLPKHERLYRGLPPLVNLRQRPRRRNFVEEPGLRDPFGFGDTGFSPMASPPATAPARFSLSDFESPRSPQSPSAYSTHSERWSSASWGARSAPLGDLLHKTVRANDELPTTPSWGALRRTPCTFTMAGVEGKASWALRRNRPRRAGGRLNPFEDWIQNGGGNANDLEWQVMQTDPGVAHFQRGLQVQSKNFHNTILKDTPQDVLHDNRVFFCKASVGVMKKAQPPAGLRTSASAGSLAELRKQLAESHDSSGLRQPKGAKRASR